jgi:hypothetical protein
MTKSKPTLDVTIKPHWQYPGVWIGTVETRQRAYSCLWTRDEAPTLDEVAEAFRADRKAFRGGYR